MDRKKTYDVTSYAEFVEAVDCIYKTWGVCEPDEFDKPGEVRKNTVFFRGHGNAEWSLDTTLERYTDCKSVAAYLRHVGKASIPLSALTGSDWQIPYDEERRVIDLMQSKGVDFVLPNLDFLIYLRHHGFPSPLLDWSESAFIALFFAFEEKRQCEFAKVCAYIAWPGRSIGYWNSRIATVGPYIKTHQRHFRQQARYTYAMVAHEDSGLEFCSHMAHVNKSTRQDVVVEIRIPTSIRREILHQLNTVNINAYTLYGSEDSLVRSLGMKAFDLD